MIFNLFKSKPSLKELIPKGFVDIHSHILPGIDDGAQNLNESLKLISEMKNMGFSKIIATPHTFPGIYDNTKSTIKDSYQMIIDKLSTKITIKYASEYMLDSSLIENAEKKSLLTLKQNYLLVEMSYFSPPNMLYEIIYQLQLNGYIPVLAHPERYSFFHNKFNELKKLKKVGCEFQLNLLSCTGYYGKDVLKISNKLISNNMIDYVGSDVHNNEQLSKLYMKVQLNDSKELSKLFYKNTLFK